MRGKLFHISVSPFQLFSKKSRKICNPTNFESVKIRRIIFENFFFKKAKWNDETEKSFYAQMLEIQMDLATSKKPTCRVFNKLGNIWPNTLEKGKTIHHK